MNNSKTINDVLDQLYYRYNTCSPKTRQVSGGWLRCQCPFHKDGKEEHASFGINLKDGFFKCFACNETGTIEGLASRFEIDIDQPITMAREQILTLDYKRVEVETVPSVKSQFTEQYINQFKQYGIPDYLLKRGLTKGTLKRYNIVQDKIGESILFPVYDLYGDPMFISKRSTNKKKFYIQKGVDLPLYLGWDLGKFNKVNPLQYKTLYVCEGPIDALSMREMGYVAVALFGLGSTNQYNILKEEIPQHDIVLALDNDSHGKTATKKLGNFLSPNKVVKVLTYPEGCKDPNDILLSFGKRWKARGVKFEDFLFQEAQSRSETDKGRQLIRFT